MTDSKPETSRTTSFIEALGNLQREHHKKENRVSPVLRGIMAIALTMLLTGNLVSGDSSSLKRGVKEWLFTSHPGCIPYAIQVDDADSFPKKLNLGIRTLFSIATGKECSDLVDSKPELSPIPEVPTPYLPSSTPSLLETPVLSPTATPHHYEFNPQILFDGERFTVVVPPESPFFDAYQELAGLTLTDLKVTSETDPATGIEYLMYQLPDRLTNNVPVNILMGVGSANYSLETMSPNTLAIRPKFPKGTSFVFGAHDFNTNPHLFTDQNLNNSPTVLSIFALVNDYNYGAFRVNDKLKDPLTGNLFMGDHLARNLTPDNYMYVHFFPPGQNTWRLYERSSLPPDGSSIFIYWNLTSGTHVRYPTELFGTLLGGFPYAVEIIAGTDMSTMPSPKYAEYPATIFRTDPTTGESDIVVVTPFMPIINPTLFDAIIHQAPLPSGKIPVKIIAGAPDLGDEGSKNYLRHLLPNNHIPLPPITFDSHPPQFPTNMDMYIIK